MNHIKFFDLFRKKTDDDKIAIGIMDKINSDILIIKNVSDGHKSNRGIIYVTYLKFTIDNFNIELRYASKNAVQLTIDGVVVNANKDILSKLIDKCEYVLDKAKQNAEYIKRDALINFRKNNEILKENK